MNVIPSDLPEVLLLEPEVYGDQRGYLLEQFQVERYAESGIRGIVQINHSRSRRGTIRGLHFQEPQAQGKLVWVPGGALFDVAVDVRVGSPSFGKWTAAELSEDNHRQMWIPPGFAHGFCVLSEHADCYYACTNYHAPDCGRAIAWNDPDLAIEWPAGEPLLSAKDAAASRLRDALHLPNYVAGRTRWCE